MANSKLIAVGVDPQIKKSNARLQLPIHAPSLALGNIASLIPPTVVSPSVVSPRNGQQRDQSAVRDLREPPLPELVLGRLTIGVVVAPVVEVVDSTVSVVVGTGVVDVEGVRHTDEK